MEIRTKKISRKESFSKTMSWSKIKTASKARTLPKQEILKTKPLPRSRFKTNLQIISRARPLRRVFLSMRIQQADATEVLNAEIDVMAVVALESGVAAVASGGTLARRNRPICRQLAIS